MGNKVKNNLRFARLIANYTQFDIATLLSMTKGNYAKMESGLIDISSKHLYRLAKFYKVSIDCLLNSRAIVSPADFNLKMMRGMEIMREEQDLLDDVDPYNLGISPDADFSDLIADNVLEYEDEEKVRADLAKRYGGNVPRPHIDPDWYPQMEDKEVFEKEIKKKK